MELHHKTTGANGLSFRFNKIVDLAGISYEHSKGKGKGHSLKCIPLKSYPVGGTTVLHLQLR